MGIKKAELSLVDADKFPLESIREKLARRYGIDAVALSGPCEGQPIVKCVCDQLSKRWDRIKDRFAQSPKKTLKLAINLAESYMEHDDTQEAITDIQKHGFDKKAASQIAGYLKAFAMDEASEEDFNQVVDDVDNLEDDVSSDEGPETPFEHAEEDNGPTDDLGGNDDVMDDDVSAPDEMSGPVDEEIVETPEEEVSIDSPDMGGMPDLDNAMIDQGGEEMVSIEIPKEVAHEIAHSIIDGIGGAGADEADDFGGPVGGDLEVEIIDQPEGGLGDIIDEAIGGEHEVPGEPMDEQGSEGEQVVTNDAPDTVEEEMTETPADEAAESPEKQQAEEEAGTEIHNNDFKNKEAALKLRVGHIKRAGETVLKLGPEMSINNTDQLGGHDDKKLGPVKEKAVQEPKELEKSVKPEGFAADGNKFQDHTTMKNEEKFDPKTVDKGSLSGGNKSLMGKDESYADKGPSVPAGSAPIGGEQFSGGNVETLGQVMASIEDDGIHVKAGSQKFHGKVRIAGLSSASIQRIATAIAALKFNGNGKDFTLAALKIATKECSDCTKIDTSKLESEQFTNDGEKKPEADKSKKSTKPAVKDPTCNNGELEAKNFTNDAEKKPEGDKKASVSKSQKTAGEKKVEEPKPLDENIKPEGYTAGGNKLQDGKTMKNEEKFDAKELDESKLSGGDKSLMGKDESYAKDGPSVPAGGPKLDGDEFEGGNVSTTKGRGAIANQSQKSQVLAAQAEVNDAKVRESRFKAASIYVADMLRHGEISETEFSKELEKVASLPVQAIQSLIVATKKARERVAAASARTQTSVVQASCGVPIVLAGSNNEKTLTEKLVSAMNLTKKMDSWDAMSEMKK